MLNVSGKHPVLPIRLNDFTIRVTKISEFPNLKNSFEIWSNPGDMLILRNKNFR